MRVCDNFAGLDGRFFRVAVRTAQENGRLCRALRKALGCAGKPAARRTPVIMFQGTGSNAGKSILAAALCRILLQDGVRVAPFKAQNMSLNSFVTRDGGEMGRAQVVQAQACRIDPDVRMNPVLLKPNSDTGSQVIVLGKPIGNMDFWEYTRDRTPPFAAAKESFDSLAAEYDAIVMEGAGSPGEVNLKKRDIVNMNMALYAEAPVLIVGDIDRGGVYASFIGTMEVLSERERALVKGFVVNRFRGQEAFLAEAHEYVLRHTGRPVIGVVPYLRDLGLPEEDSVSFKDGLIDGRVPAGEHVEIAVIDLPHISNFTDFDPLRIEPDVRLRVVRNPAELDTPDAVILPGSKNVIGDLAELQSCGMAQKIGELAREGRTEIIGLCGGLQILGTRDRGSLRHRIRPRPEPSRSGAPPRPDGARPGEDPQARLRPARGFGLRGTRLRDPPRPYRRRQSRTADPARRTARRSASAPTAGASGEPISTGSSTRTDSAAGSSTASGCGGASPRSAGSRPSTTWSRPSNGWPMW